MKCETCKKEMPDNPLGDCKSANDNGLEGYIANNDIKAEKAWCSKECFEVSNTTNGDVN